MLAPHCLTMCDIMNRAYLVQDVYPVCAFTGAWLSIMNNVHNKVIGRVFVFGLDLWW